MSKPAGRSDDQATDVAMLNELSLKGLENENDELKKMLTESFQEKPVTECFPTPAIWKY